MRPRAAQTLVGVMSAAAASVLGCDGSGPSGAANHGGQPAGEGPAAVFVSAPCQDREQANGITASCGYVTVPEREDDPAGGTIKIRVARIHGKFATGAGDPIVYLDGGPGGSSIANAVYYGAWAIDSGLKVLLAERDLIAIDLRGTGGSTPALTCDGVAIAALGPEEPRNDEFAPTLITACRKALAAAGATLSAYGTSAAARDVTRVIGALALPRFDLMGVSHGARVALEVLRRPPAGLHAVVLDSLIPPDADVLPEEGRALARAYDLAMADCEGDPVCLAEAPDPRGALPEIVARLDATPMDVSTHGGSVTLTGRSFVEAVRGSLRDGDRKGRLARQLHAARGGEYGFFAAVLGSPRGQGSVGAALGVACAEQMAVTSAAAIETAAAAVPAPLAAGLVGRFYALACPLWDVPAAPPALRTPVSSAVPVLLLAGHLDPWVPPDWSRQAARTLSAAHVMEVPEAGHAVIHGICAASNTLRFLTDLSAPGTSSLCPPRPLE
jgi:pimeloyl-ACP methyl ester carboxylesterase